MFLWVKLRLSILGQASISPICYRWLFITSAPPCHIPFTHSPVWLPLCLFPWGQSEAPGPPSRSSALDRRHPHQSNKKKLPVVRAILTLCISPSSDKRLMLWHAHKIDRSFKDHTSGFSLFSPLTVNCFYLTLLQTIFPTMHVLPSRQSLVSVCVSLLCKSTCRGLLMTGNRSVNFQSGLSALSKFFNFIIGNTETVLGTFWWCISRHPSQDL